MFSNHTFSNYNFYIFIGENYFNDNLMNSTNFMELRNSLNFQVKNWKNNFNDFCYCQSNRLLIFYHTNCHFQNLNKLKIFSIENLRLS